MLGSVPISNLVSMMFSRYPDLFFSWTRYLTPERKPLKLELRVDNSEEVTPYSLGSSWMIRMDELLLEKESDSSIRDRLIRRMADHLLAGPSPGISGKLSYDCALPDDDVSDDHDCVDVDSNGYAIFPDVIDFKCN